MKSIFFIITFLAISYFLLHEASARPTEEGDCVMVSLHFNLNYFALYTALFCAVLFYFIVETANLCLAVFVKIIIDTSD